jgi:hypothetical protein
MDMSKFDPSLLPELPPAIRPNLFLGVSDNVDLYSIQIPTYDGLTTDRKKRTKSIENAASNSAANHTIAALGLGEYDVTQFIAGSCLQDI